MDAQAYFVALFLIVLLVSAFQIVDDDIPTAVLLVLIGCAVLWNA